MIISKNYFLSSPFATDLLGQKVFKMITANAIFFGVEMETICPSKLVDRDGFYIGSYHHPIQVPFLPDGWEASRDGSIEAPRGYVQCEIVSPILKGADGLRQIQQVCQILTSKGFKVNKSTGVHVSVDWGRYTSSESLSRLITMVAYCEPAIYAITGTHSREQGRWARSIKQYGTVIGVKEKTDKDGYDDCHARYHILNLTNLHRGQDRVEFRAFTGSLNPVKICGWVQVCVGLVQKAKNASKRSTWDYSKPEKTIKRLGSETMLAISRLKVFLGWLPSRIKNGKSFGLIEGSPISREQIIKEFERLGKKYDAEIIC